MLDIKWIRDNAAVVKDAARKKRLDVEADIDRVLSLDAKRREILVELENLKHQQNK